jgi:predicted  nucleic acid-binding Zn-ribbon protein
MQNKCKKCGYTWYPRGKNISRKCPGCGSNEVGYAGGGAALAALIIVGMMIFGGGKKPNSTASASNVSNEAASSTIITETGNRLETTSSSQERQRQPECPEDDTQSKGAYSSKCGDKAAVKNELF